MNVRIVLYLLVGALWTWIGASSAHALPAPQYTLRSKIENSVGKTPSTTIGQLQMAAGGSYTLSITVQDHDQAVALASVMTLSHKIGNVAVDITVTDGNGMAVVPTMPANADDLAALVKSALKGNPLFHDVVVNNPISGSAVVYPVFEPYVIQFPNDDISDLYENFNGVAAAVFKDVLLLKAGGHPGLPH